MPTEYSAYDEMINHAIDIGDFDWATHLVHSKYSQPTGAYTCEIIGCQYGILENGYIRRIREVSEDEFINSELIELPFTYTKSGEYVELKPVELSKRIFIYGYYKGYSSVSWQKPIF